jgi:hypothetical protein
MDQQQCASRSRETRAVREPFSARLPHGTLTVSGHATMHRSGSSGPGCASFGSCNSSRPSARHVEEEMLLVCWSAGAANGGDGIGGFEFRFVRLGFESCRRSLACTAPAGEGLLRGALRAASRGRRALHCAAGGLALAVLVESARPPPVWSGWRLAPWTGWRGWRIIPSLLAARAPTRRHKNTAGGWRTGGCWRICPLRAHGDKILPQRSAALPLRGHGISRARPHLASPGRPHHHSFSSILTSRQTSDPLLTSSFPLLILLLLSLTNCPVSRDARA